MATVTSRPTPTAPANLDPQVLHPLDRLRGTVRRYVVIEGLLSAAIFVAAWFALGMLLDFGLFKVATWDWVLDAPLGLRAAALVVSLLLLAGIVTFRIIGRLTKELSYPALALVLERRFPKVLGDRLITAVELADVDRQAGYGYSRDMIRQTIDEARERVGTVPVNDVFNWRRLWRMAALAAGLVLAVLAVGFASFAIGTKTANPVRFGWKFAHTASVFAERNVLLWNTPWPRRAHLEFVGFDGTERRIPKDAAETDVHVKAYRWVVADRDAPMGWRPMTWGDLPRFVGTGPELPVAALRAAADGELGDDPATWQVDQVQAIGMDDPEARTKLVAAISGPEYESLRTRLDGVFAEMNQQAERPSMGRTLRRLDVPDSVKLVYSGQTKSGDITLGPIKNQEFKARVSELKETIHFVVRAEDFRTPNRTVTLIPPPMFTQLTRTEYQPAYLHHSPPEGDYSALRGLRQRMADKALSLTGDRTVLTVKSGTELVLTAKADTDLTEAFLQPKVGILPGAKPGSAEPVPIPVGDDKRTVTVEFRGDYRLAAGRTIDHYYIDEDGWIASAPVTTTPTIEFDLVIKQADGVPACRQVLIQVAADQAPAVELAVETLRKVGNVYYVTPKARIPFNPESFVHDDNGLSKVAYEFSYWTEDSDIGRALRAQLAARPFLYAPGVVAIPAAVAPVYHAVSFKMLDKGDSRKTGSAELRRFTELQRELIAETRQRLADLLQQPRDEGDSRMVKKVEFRPLAFRRDDDSGRLTPDGDYFDLAPLKLLASVSEVQPRYRMDLNVVAADTNYDTGPKTGQNAEPIRLMIVSEGDLLAEINKEEETFATRLDDALNKIVASRKRWEVIRTFNTTGRTTADPTKIDDARIKAQDVAQDIGKARDTAQSVVRDYRRIHKECTVNDVTEVTRDRFGTFANRIDRVVGENPPAVTREEEARARAGALQPKMTFTEADRRIQLVLAALNANQWAEVVAVSDSEIALFQLEQEVRAIREALGELQNKEKLKALLESVIKRQEEISAALRDWNIKLQENALKKEPDLGGIGPVFLAKGEAKKLRHTINWRQYQKDDLALKLLVVDKAMKPAADALTVPATVKLNFEKNQLDFEYEVKAGTKEGEYALIITPEAGDPITVTVTVK